MLADWDWDKVLKNGPGKICGRQPLKSLSYSLPKTAGLTKTSGSFHIRKPIKKFSLKSSKD